MDISLKTTNALTFLGMRNLIVLACLFMPTSEISAQVSRDTIVNSIKFNFVDYYSNGKVKVLGNYERDTIKYSNWVYYKINGDILAYGKYVNGYKLGKWRYSGTTNSTITRKWRQTDLPLTEGFGYLQNGDLIIYDSIYTKPCITVFRNGFPTTSIRLM